MKLSKFGTASGLTSGRVSSLNVNMKVFFSGKQVDFANQIMVENEDFIAKPGDSGAVFFDENAKAVGLLFAGNGGPRCLANPIDDVLEKLSVQSGKSLLRKFR